MIIEAVRFVIAGAGGGGDDLTERQTDIESCDGNVRSGSQGQTKCHLSKSVVWEQRTECSECT